MTMIMSCDHHDASGSLPDNRSRRRMLEQLLAAVEVGEAVLELARMGMDIRLSTRAGELQVRPTIEVDLDRFMTLWTQLMLWENAFRPRGDDLVPAVSPPAEIRIPADPGATRTDVRE